MCARAKPSALSDTIGDAAAALQERLLGRCRPRPARGRAGRSRQSDQSTAAVLRVVGAGPGPVFLPAGLLVTNRRHPAVSPLHALPGFGVRWPGYRRAVTNRCGYAPCSSLVVA